MACQNDERKRAIIQPEVKALSALGGSVSSLTYVISNQHLVLVSRADEQHARCLISSSERLSHVMLCADTCVVVQCVYQ